MSELPSDEQELLINEVSDHALESAALISGDKSANYTLYFCTALDLCPGP
jgi:hypothetical protein